MYATRGEVDVSLAVGRRGGGDLMPSHGSTGSAIRKIGLRAWLSLGALSMVALGSGFFAVTNDQVTVEDNRVETSGDAPSEDALDIQVAEAVPVPGETYSTCLGGSVQWQDVSITARFDSSIDVGAGERVFEGEIMCLRRLDEVDATADITAFVANFVQTDPTCAQTETDEDVTCGTSEAGSGEISQYVTWETVLDLNPDICTPFGQRGTGAAALNEGASDQIIGLTPGSSNPICVGFQLVTNMAEGNPGLKALLTDVATWDWLVEASLGGFGAPSGDVVTFPRDSTTPPQ